MKSQTRSSMHALLAGMAVSIGVGLFLTIAARAADQDAGWYTKDQAQGGHVTFNSWCAQCHRPDLSGAMGPALVGQAFLKTWANRPIGDLYSFEHKNMPANNPGAVPKDKLWDITAFILQKNGLAAGSTRLDAAKASRVLTSPKS